MQIGRCRIFSLAACADNQVNGRQLMLMQSERLADDTADPVALDTAARSTDCDGETETRPAFIVPHRSHAKESIAKPSPARVGRIKVRLTT
jgi:hypothetical protein